MAMIEGHEGSLGKRVVVEEDAHSDPPIPSVREAAAASELCAAPVGARRPAPGRRLVAVTAAVRAPTTRASKAASGRKYVCWSFMEEDEGRWRTGERDR